MNPTAIVPGYCDTNSINIVKCTSSPNNPLLLSYNVTQYINGKPISVNFQGPRNTEHSLGLLNRLDMERISKAKTMIRDGKTCQEIEQILAASACPPDVFQSIQNWMKYGDIYDSRISLAVIHTLKENGLYQDSQQPTQ